MSAATLCLIALLIGGLGPTLWIASRGDAGDRLIGLELAAGVIVFVLILFSQVSSGQSYDLVLPLVLVPLSFAGTLVFTRLLGRGPGAGN
jgi:multisubunit Na+/H+ antiporter MnhF subunit